MVGLSRYILIGIREVQGRWQLWLVDLCGVVLECIEGRLDWEKSSTIVSALRGVSSGTSNGIGAAQMGLGGP